MECSNLMQVDAGFDAERRGCLLTAEVLFVISTPATVILRSLPPGTAGDPPLLREFPTPGLNTLWCADCAFDELITAELSKDLVCSQRRLSCCAVPTGQLSWTGSRSLAKWVSDL